ncbi:DUF2309 domain-containing protein [Siansivirga zeaxanthinifaciens]|uniref:Probable inorganic carbon transporter subunit DabA n=1 Tax=Siansivirga zeaxanthinifaciens CC-SAMT-1 TaxID=1454006 RepID=A0A0C5WCU4_9FLAO|nr:DUF2309 domain-containing protein [Siansivirga zeaxanthinifaciens]AJR03104.1 hypothetical protein AW14_05085 [Siansivirga zeaxanthinifaciens CC-SAMT-1]
MINESIKNSLNEASKVIGKTWPLYSFVTSNPLSGYEQKPFKEALAQAEHFLNANVLPSADLLTNAWEEKKIDKQILLELLKENNLLESPEYYLSQIVSHNKQASINDTNFLDRMMAKWLAAFMDEGLAEWEMPNKKEGFYSAWRKLAKYDNELPKIKTSDLPSTSAEALKFVLKEVNENDLTKIFTYHLAALPGWTGYINYRTESNNQWQNEYPINLEEYLAVRLMVAHITGTSIYPKNIESAYNPFISKLQYLWLKAWEKSWQNELEKLLNFQEEASKTTQSNQVPDAQMVFCIDTRSELIRRHIENKGHYETFGYAGFFGIAMDYESAADGITRKSCPPIVNSAYHVSEIAQENHSENFKTYKDKNKVLKFRNYFIKRMKNMLPSAFGFVEGSGFFYGLILTLRTLLPNQFYRLYKRNSMQYETICEPKIESACNHTASEDSIPLNEKVGIVKSAFDLMGWKTFAPVVVFVGHGSHTTNNPFGSSLDCGACAASPGRHNARMLAKLANLPEVKKVLNETHNLEMPENTVFVGAEHNTTTDEIVFFDADVPQSHKSNLEKIKSDLLKAQKTATQERLGVTKNSVALANKKANNWGETRPEWGLAKNAAFIVGPRELTKDKNLEGRAFLHSYNWEADTTGKALEGIMQGPMVVTQWINNHYYFSTVDNTTFGSGSKITHNVIGKFGVVQGNGGDLKMGLPLQSLMQTDSEMYHQPLRLSVVIQAPVSRVSEILLRNENLKNLLDNEWIYLMVMDPTNSNKISSYKKNLNWISENLKDMDKQNSQPVKQKHTEVLV